MFKAIAAVLAFAAFLVFAPESRADSGVPDASPMVTLDWV